MCGVFCCLICARFVCDVLCGVVWPAFRVCLFVYVCDVCVCVWCFLLFNVFVRFVCGLSCDVVWCLIVLFVCMLAVFNATVCFVFDVLCGVVCCVCVCCVCLSMVWV